MNIERILQTLKETKPLVHHITNYVTVNDCANITLAIGASPIMADAREEAADIASISSALVLNMGTLNERTVESMLLAGAAANDAGIPVVFDPVGAGASPYRSTVAEEIIRRVDCMVLRGNLSEIRAVAGLAANTKGVDAAESDILAQDGEQTAVSLAKELSCTVAITGAVDIVTDGSRIAHISNGTPYLSKVTGTGCMTTSLIGSYCACTKDGYDASVLGLLTMGIAGEIAYDEVGHLGSGNFRMHLMDAVSRMDAGIIQKRGKLHEEAY